MGMRDCCGRMKNEEGEMKGRIKYTALFFMVLISTAVSLQPVLSRRSRLENVLLQRLP